ncbi:MAG: trehalose-phosphatase [Chloroflexota bacterium]
MLEHLLSVWPEMAARFRGARHILLMTDYDGTLTPIVERPELAELAEPVRRLLRALAHERHFTVGVVSGRALPDLKDRVRLSNIVYAGNHGLEVEGPGISFVNPLAEELRPVLRILNYVLCQALGKIKGVLVEDKGLTLSIHYRLADPGRVGELRSVVEKIVGHAEAAGKVKRTSGKKVYEVRPRVAWDKGKAVKLLMRKYANGDRRSGLLPVYLGDDATDEDAFRAIGAYGSGVSVFVGEPGAHSSAGYFLKSPAEVATFLGKLLEQSNRRAE